MGKNRIKNNKNTRRIKREKKSDRKRIKSRNKKSRRKIKILIRIFAM
jgi:hypothetical protein